MSTIKGKLHSDEQRLVVYIVGKMDLDRAPVLHAALHTAVTQPGSQSETAVPRRTLLL
ncbi:hypothetical protein ABZ667_43820 [Streptomyces lavendulae]|uniref:hypothetical protein n=1 Tax=Streptomyces lavendulae TaxID=1914 RepID=UPI0033C1B932